MNEEIKSIMDLLAKTPNLFQAIYKQGAITSSNVIDYISLFTNESKVIFNSYMRFLNKEEQNYIREVITNNLIEHYLYEKNLDTKNEDAKWWENALDVNILSFIKKKSNNNSFWEEYKYRKYPTETLVVLNEEQIFILNTKENGLTDDLLFTIPDLTDFKIMLNLFIDKDKVKSSLDLLLSKPDKINEKKYLLLGACKSYIEEQHIKIELDSVTKVKIKNRL